MKKANGQIFRPFLPGKNTTMKILYIRLHSSRVLKRCAEHAAFFTFIATCRTDTRNERRLIEWHFYSHTVGFPKISHARGKFNSESSSLCSDKFYKYRLAISNETWSNSKPAGPSKFLRIIPYTQWEQRDVKFHNIGSERGITSHVKSNRKSLWDDRIIETLAPLSNKIPKNPRIPRRTR